MLSVLEGIIEIIANVPAYILYAIEAVANLFFSAIQGVFEAATALIELPEIPTIPYLAEVNWFFPVGSILGILSLMVAGYITFLAVRWIFKWAGAL